MSTRVVVDDDEQQLADLEADLRRLRSRLATTAVTGTHDEFTAAATPSTTYTLTYIPLSGTCLMALNGHVQREGVDYSVAYDTGVVTVSATQASGDKITFRYLITDWLVARSLTPDVGGIFDNFNRANATSGTPSALGTTSDGNGIWGDVVGGWGISSNTAYPVTIPAGFGSIAISDIACLSADGTVSVDVTVASNAQGLAVRVLDRQNYICVATDGLFEVSTGSGPGTFTRIATLSLGASTGTLSIVMAGSSLTVKWNGVTQAAVTSTWQQTQTHHGIGVFSSVSSSRMDNWSYTP